MAVADRKYTQKSVGAWVQPGGPNTQPYYIGCVDVGDITEPAEGRELIQCRGADRKYHITGERITPPGLVTATITGLTGSRRSWLDRAVKNDCPFSVYAMIPPCGRLDVFSNNARSYVLHDAKSTGGTIAAPIHHMDDNDLSHSYDLGAYPPVYDLDPLEIDRITTTEAAALNDIISANAASCAGDCGTTMLPGQELLAVADAGVGVTANVLRSTDSGATWAATAADPFAINKNIVAACGVYITPTQIRYIVAMEAPAGAQGMISYTDDNGATWTTVNIGGAAAGHGATRAGGLFALDSNHIWLAGAAGYVYFSADGGQSWTAVESGVVTTGAYTAVSFSDEYNGAAVAAAGIVAVTHDGGATWEAAAVIGSGAAGNLCVAALDENRLWVGDNAGKLWYTADGGTTWTQRIGWTGSGTGTIAAIGFVNDHIGYMVKNTAGPVGSILRTINGGWTWDVITTPGNAGLNSLAGIDENNAFAVGEPSGGTAVIVQVG